MRTCWKVKYSSLFLTNKPTYHYERKSTHLIGFSRTFVSRLIVLPLEVSELVPGRQHSARWRCHWRIRIMQFFYTAENFPPTDNRHERTRRNVLDSYSGGVRLQSRDFSCSEQSLRQITGAVSRFTPRSLPSKSLPIHVSSHNSTLYSPATDSIVNNLQQENNHHDHQHHHNHFLSNGGDAQFYGDGVVKLALAGANEWTAEVLRWEQILCNHRTKFTKCARLCLHDPFPLRKATGGITSHHALAFYTHISLNACCVPALSTIDETTCCSKVVPALN
jgi:hypothetical protein